MKIKNKCKVLLLLLLTAVLVISTACQPKTDPPKTDPTPTPTTKKTDVPATPGKTEPPATTTVDDGSLTYDDGTVMTAPGVFPIVEKGVTLSIGLRKQPFVISYGEDNDYTKYIKEKLGITLDIIDLGTSAADAKQQLLLRIEGKEKLPDIIWGISLGKYELYRYGEQGVFRALDDYFAEYGYFFNEKMEALKKNDPSRYKSAMANFKSDDGHSYAYPRLENGVSNQYDKQWYINKSWLDKLGLKIPQTTDDLYNVLKAFRDNDVNGNGDPNDEIPICGSAPGSGAYVPQVEFPLLQPFLYYTTQSQYNAKDGKLYFWATEPDYRDGLAFVAKLVKENLLPDFTFTQTNAQFRAIVDPPEGEPSRVGVVVENMGFAFNSADSQRKLEYDALPPLTGPKGKCYASLYTTNTFYQYYITRDCKYPEIAFRFFDAHYEEVTGLTSRYGAQDGNWRYLKKGEKFVDRYKQLGIPTLIATKQNVFSGENKLTWGVLAPFCLPRMNVTGEESIGMTEYDPKNPSHWGSLVHDKGMFMRWGKEDKEVVPASLPYTEEEANARKDNHNSLSDYIYDHRYKFMSGELDVTDDKVWEDYLTGFKARGSDELLASAQRAYDRLK